MLSLVIPVYKNEANLDRLLPALVALAERMAEPMEAVFVVDGSPDRCAEILAARLPGLPLRSRLVLLSRNFGSFAAIRAGLECGTGDLFAVLAADLQEPPELIERFAETLSGGAADIVFGCRNSRSDPWLARLAAGLFWATYRRFVIPEMPAGGIDVFACTREVRDRVLALRESNTNLVALLLWVGYRRQFVLYDRAARLEGKSAWTFGKKLRYAVDSVFSFTDLPIQLLSYVGILGMAFAVLLALIIIVAKALGKITVPGYTPIVLTIAFFGALTSLGLGIVGQYLWLTLQNARSRPGYLIASTQSFGPNRSRGAASTIVGKERGGAVSRVE
jgi:glycosyltransferase involved in cell wall biosynthesis